MCIWFVLCTPPSPSTIPSHPSTHTHTQTKYNLRNTYSTTCYFVFVTKKKSAGSGHNGKSDPQSYYSIILRLKRAPYSMLQQCRVYYIQHVVEKTVIRDSLIKDRDYFVIHCDTVAIINYNGITRCK